MDELQTAPSTPAAPEEGGGARHALAATRSHYRENGFVWTACQVLIWGAETAIRLLRRQMRTLERSRGLTGLHTKEANREGWNTYDWSQRGEEWTDNAEWRQALIDEVLIANMPPDPSSLEIGPGGGRWTETLQKKSKHLVITDIADEPIRICRERFADADNMEFHVTDGSSLGPVSSDSVDFVWSFDVFVHIAPADQEGYVREFARVMRPGARAVIHHAGRGGLDGGWRTGQTAERFAAMLAPNGFELERQFDSWGAANQHVVPIPGDVITVFSKPAAG